MAKHRGKEHTTLTETATLVVAELNGISGVKMIAPGEIRTGARRRGGGRHVTAIYTTAGMELLISGQSVQKVAVHVSADRDPKDIFTNLKLSKKLKHFEFRERERKPGV